VCTLDAVHGPYKKGQTWADPSVSHAATLMTQVVDNNEKAKQSGQQAAQDIGEMLAPENIGKMLRGRLDEIHAQVIQELAP